jgi:hypothetical protein
MDNFEKNYERTEDKAVDAVGKVGNAANRVYIGCITIIANLFFVGFCLWGVYAAYTGWQLQTKGETTTGTVIQFEVQSDGSSPCCTSVPVIQFRVEGRTFSFKGGTASDSPAYDVGDVVKVRYNPADPNTAQIDNLFERWLLPVILIPAMILAALILNFFMIRAWRRGEYLEYN